ncbi:MAG: sulfotransferase [Parvularculaceae bacterium]|jgi:tetratricopeptide (TPR) repeat protein|nr:sulfotransferase [Parvularculaceae bacterium]
MTSPADELIAAGNAAYAAGRFAEAIDMGRRAVAADPHNPWSYNLLGAACAEEMEHDDARAAFHAAVAADPRIALSRVNLAYALILAGEFSEAEAQLNEALALDPDMPAAFLNLTWIRRAQPGDRLIARLEELRARPGADRQARSIYAFALGKCYDDIGEYDYAFACFREGNELAGVKFDDAACEARFWRIKSVFNREFLDKHERAGFASAKPVFIVGMPRCGSSLLEDQLARHPGVAALGERPEITRIVGLISANHPGKVQYPDWAPKLPAEAFEGFGRRYVEKFEKRHVTAARLIDKNLMNFQFLGLIRLMLPAAAVIHCRRDPVDTCLSCYFQFLRSEHSYKFDLRALGRYYRLHADLMAHWRDLLGDLITVDYDAFVDRPEAEYERVLTALDLSPAEASTGAPKPRHIQTSSAYQARQPISRTSVARWRNYEKHLGPLIDALAGTA